MTKNIDICIVGGCGHVGLPLGLAFADRGKRVALYDVNVAAVEMVNAGKMPFKEEGAPVVLTRVLGRKKLFATTEGKVVKRSKTIIVVIGTPVDEHLNPHLRGVMDAIRDIEKYLTGEQLLVLRSTVYPGTTEKIHSHLASRKKKTLIAFCPERIAEGHALKELRTLPQIVSGTTPKAAKEAKKLFSILAKKTITTSPIEAELAKLFTNSWRYVNFAISNQFYMIAHTHGIDFHRIRDAMIEDYPRLTAFAGAGFAAGPCLLKDTMQLSSFSNHNFFMGHSAMLVNEGLPDFVISHMKRSHDLHTKVVAILGMAFKGESDDHRESLSYKLKKKLDFEALKVLCHDPYVRDRDLVDLDTIRREADIVVIAAPHKAYKKENWRGKEVIDVWNFYGTLGLPK